MSTQSLEQKSPFEVIVTSQLEAGWSDSEFCKIKQPVYGRLDTKEDIRLSTPRDCPRELMGPVSLRPNRVDFREM